MLTILALAAFERIVNDWIDLDAATRLGFDQLAGDPAQPASKLLRVVIDSPNLSVDVLFDHGRIRLTPTALGQAEEKSVSVFEQRPYDKAFAPIQATTTLHVPHLIALAKLLGAEAGSTGNLPIQGDMALLQNLQKIIANAEPDIAGKLAPLVGDMPAQQIAQMLKQGRQAFTQAGKTFYANSEEWVKEDSQIFAARWHAEHVVDGVQDMQSDLERLQARIAQLQAQQSQQ